MTVVTAEKVVTTVTDVIFGTVLKGVTVVTVLTVVTDVIFVTVLKGVTVVTVVTAVTAVTVVTFVTVMTFLLVVTLVTVMTVVTVVIEVTVVTVVQFVTIMTVVTVVEGCGFYVLCKISEINVKNQLHALYLNNGSGGITNYPVFIVYSCCMSKLNMIGSVLLLMCIPVV